MATSRKSKTKVPAKKKIVKTKTLAGESPHEAGKRYVSGKAEFPWEPRPFQMDVFNAFDAGIKRFCLNWHRRAGKDIFGMSLARREMRHRIGSYVHFFPKHVHAKRALWRGVDPRKGARFIDIAFGDIEAERNNQDMLIEAYNGSTWALLGSDNYDSTVIGGNVVGVVFSEWALCDPNAWDYIRPILRENGGWAVFITTFRGRNHAWQMYQTTKENPDWYTSKLTVEDTTDVNGNRIITDADVEADRRDGMKESLIQQEYYCNPEATADGAIYGIETEALVKEESRHVALWTPDKPVYCVWNLDLPVHASYVLVQDNKVLEASSERFTTLAHAVAKAEQRSYPVQQHILHGANREYVRNFIELDRSPAVLANTDPVLEQSQASRFLAGCSINKEACGDLLDSLGGYVRRESFDGQTAEHKWSPNAVDSWHFYLVGALETWAVWQYYLDTGSGKTPDYSLMDRIARTVK